MPERIVRITASNELDSYSFVFEFELDQGRWYIVLETPNTDELVQMLKSNPLVAVQGGVTSDFRYSARDLPALVGFVLRYWADI